MSQLNDFERTALSIILSGETDWIGALRLQIPLLHVTSRSYNSAGGYSVFSVSDKAQKAIIPDYDPNYPPVAIVTHRNLVDGGAVIIWTENGLISYLEAVCDGDGEWPVNADVDEFEFKSS